MTQYEFFDWHGYQVNKTEAWQVYQDICDEVFGEYEIDIVRVEWNNAVLLHLKFENMFEIFYEELKALLERLKEKMASKDAMELLVKTVEEVVDPDDGVDAFAQLLAWDRLWLLFEHNIIDLKDLAASVIYDTRENVDPFRLAEAHRLMVFEKFGNDIMAEDKHIVVLVKAPWMKKKCLKEDVADTIYYRNLARRTFIEHLDDDETALYDVTDDYYGFGQVKDAIEQLNGIVVIDMTAGDDNDQVVCHAFENPNSKVMTENDHIALKVAVLCGDELGLYEDFESDNY